jgi:glycosyltransferase involved in cell wall biosynthesis
MLESSSPRKLLFILKNGPIYSTTDHIEHQLSVLAKTFDCELWSRGPRELDTVFTSGARVRVIKSQHRPSYRETLQFIRLAGRRIRQLAEERRGTVAVIAHDPLKSGLMGVYLSLLARGPLIVEVNGAYGNLGSYNVTRPGLKTTLKIALFRSVAAFVLWHASGVRLLFAEQLDGFATIRHGKVRRQFFDIPALDRFQNTGEEPTILFVGFPFFTKGVDVLIKAFDSLGDEFPEWKLLVVGHDLVTQAKALSSNPRMVVMKAVSNEELAPIVNRCGIFVLPSRSEAMGRVLLEAAAAGKPRIGSRVGGIPTVIADEQDGLLFKREDVAGLAAALRRLMGSPELRKKFGDAARKRVDAEFTGAAYVRYTQELVDAAFAAYRGKRVPASKAE